MSTNDAELAEALAGYRATLGGRAVGVARAAAGRAPALDDRLRAAGLEAGPADESELDRLDVLAKDALPGLQSARPFGGLLAEGVEAVRAFASPGPIYEPQPPGADPWGWAPALRAVGIGAGDVVLNCFSYHLSPAGMMFDEGCRAVGARVVPAGVGMQDVQARAIADLGVTAFIGLPSYLASLFTAYDEADLPGDRWRLSKALVTAEPLPPDLRERLRTRVETVLMSYGTAEAGLIGYETEPDGGLRPGPGVYLQICDPATGQEVPAGDSGEVVVSVLSEKLPLLRFGTGDVSRWVAADDGPRLAGVLGRVGAAVKVRGMFVHPHQAAEVLGGLREAGAETGRFLVQRAGDRDVLRLDLVATADADTDALLELAERRARDRLRVRPEVHLVDTVDDSSPLLDQR